MKILPVGAELFHADGRTDGHDEANSLFSQLCETRLQTNINGGKVGYYEFCSNYISCCYLLTYSMVQSPSWAANWFAATQEIPRISQNQKVHYRTHKRPPPTSILGQPNPVHIPTYHLLEIHPNIIHPSTPRSPQWYLSLRFPHQDPIHSPFLPHTRHMPIPSHSCYKNLYKSTLSESVFNRFSYAA